MTGKTFGDLLNLDAPGDDDEPTTTPGKLVPGDRVHFYGTVTLSTSTEGSFGGAVVEHGSTITVTDALIEANKDRTGASIFDLIDRLDEQERRFGKVMFARGPFPANAPRFERGSAEESWARQAAREAAAGISDPEQRAAAQRANRDAYGVESTQRSSKIFGGAL